MSSNPDGRKVSIDQHLTVADVAGLLACSSRTILRQIEAGEFTPRPININGRWRVPSRAVSNYIARKRV